MADILGKASKPTVSKQDDSIMGTNNSSIVSKRSVERLYYPGEPHYFRYFVKRPQRRAPLINRGYWLRMKAIEHVVRKFLDESSDKPKFVINLGCGYDPNPWQYFYRYPEACKNVTFIDIDYMPLMKKKRDVVRSTTALNEMLVNLAYPESGDILLRSNQYLQIGCDLRQLSRLSNSLASVLDINTSVILCTAEVSITYMNVEEADALIKWVSNLPHARFCLLEQILPEGPEHPFATTMLAHFQKLNTPINAITKYPTLADQELRFRNNGWNYVQGIDLWNLWCCNDFLTSTQRMALDTYEPFDEWEEFILFTSHYFLLTASNGVAFTRLDCKTLLGDQPDSLLSDAIIGEMTYVGHHKSHGLRRFGAPLRIRGNNRERDFVGDFGGIGVKTRVNSYDIYGPSPVSLSNQMHHKISLIEMPSPRMCHTVTDLGDFGALLVGGRTSPDNGLVDCWLYHKWTGIWEHTDDLPGPRYRHSAVAIGSGSVLVAGGKSNSQTILEDICLWSRRRGWVKCAIKFATDNVTDLESKNLATPGNEHFSIFGANLGILEMSHSTTQEVTGILAGGLTHDGLVSDNVWIWTLYVCNDGDPSILLARAKADPYVSRFGATVLSHSSQLFVVGGLARNGIVVLDKDIVVLDIITEGESGKRVQLRRVHLEHAFTRPLLIGSSISNSGDSLIITGGGAVCFSFGTFWNRGCFSINLSMVAGSVRSQTRFTEGTVLDSWRYLETVEPVSSKRLYNHLGTPSAPTTETNFGFATVQRMKISSKEDFSVLLCLGRPVILEELDLGSCTKSWTSTYLKDRIGVDKMVVVHHSSAEHMDFVSKNFRYVAMPFGEFMQAVDDGNRLYLRSLSAEKPSELPADLDLDFPMISSDFQLPSELSLVKKNAHSSALRISGPVQMWLHYDVMANVLCQVQGHRKLLLFPPSDIQYFQFLPGASSSSIDVFSKLKGAELARAHPHEAVLRPGDVLFIPPFWLHAASPTAGRSVAVNVFFRNLDSGYAAGKDIYGNRDLQAYEKGRQDITRIAKSFGSLPSDTRAFYIWRLAEELKNMAGPDS